MFSNMKEMKILMKNNPVFIPRNNLVKEAIEKAYMVIKIYLMIY